MYVYLLDLGPGSNPRYMSTFMMLLRRFWSIPPILQRGVRMQNMSPKVCFAAPKDVIRAKCWGLHGGRA